MSVPLAKWIGDRLANPAGVAPEGMPLKGGLAWPKAAWGHAGKVYAVDVSMWPVRSAAPSLRDFLKFPRSLLSHRAAAGFLSRALISGLNFQEGFLDDVSRHADGMRRVA